MAVVADIGTFLVTTAHTAGQTYTLTFTFSETPELLLLTTCDRSDATDAVGSRSMQRSFGIARSTASRWAVGSSSQDAQANAATASAQRTDACLVIPNYTGAALFTRVDLSSVSAGQAVFVLDEQSNALSVQVSVLALAGLTATSIGEATEPATATTQDIAHGLGGTPDLVLFATCGATSAGNFVAVDSIMGIGAMTAGDQACWLGAADNGVATMDTASYCIDLECLAIFGIAMGLTGRAERGAAMDGTNFQLNWLEVNGANNRRFQWLAIRGGLPAVKSFLTQTDTTTAITITTNHQPVGALFISHCKPESTQNAPDAHDELSIGMAVSASSRVAHAMIDEDNQPNSETATAIEYDEVYANISTTDVIEGLMDVSSVTSTGWSCLMDDADPAQAFGFCVSFGNAAAAGGGPAFNASRAFNDGVTIGRHAFA